MVSLRDYYYHYFSERFAIVITNLLSTKAAGALVHLILEVHQRFLRLGSQRQLFLLRLRYCRKTVLMALLRLNNYLEVSKFFSEIFYSPVFTKFLFENFSKKFCLRQIRILFERPRV